MSTLDRECKSIMYLHSPIHLLGSIISLDLVSSSSSFRVLCFVLRSLICCCRFSRIFNLLLKYIRPCGQKIEMLLVKNHYYTPQILLGRQRGMFLTFLLTIFFIFVYTLEKGTMMIIQNHFNLPTQEPQGAELEWYCDC